MEHIRIVPSAFDVLAEPAPPPAMSQPAVSKPLRVLRDAGLVEARVDAQRRVYSLRAEPLAEIDAWLAPYRKVWRGKVSTPPPPAPHHHPPPRSQPRPHRGAGAPPLAARPRLARPHRAAGAGRVVRR